LSTRRMPAGNTNLTRLRKRQEVVPENSVSWIHWLADKPRGLPTALFAARRFRRSADVHVAQIPQHAFILFAHATRKIRVVQMLVAGRLRHVLQHSQPLLNRALAIRRHLTPFRRQVVLDVIPLSRCQFPPIVGTWFELLPLGRRKTLKLSITIDSPLLFLRAQFAKFPIWRPSRR